MKKSIHIIVLLGITCLFFPLPGCGSGDEKAEIDLEEIVKSEDKGAQVEAPPVGETEAISEQAVVYVSAVSDEIIIENQGYETDRKKPVKFSHKRHMGEYDIACVKCHHVYQDGKNIWKEGDPVEKCADCHDPTEDQDDVMKLQTTYHNNCKNCHKEVSKEGKEAPYQKCSDCHG